MVTVFPNSSWIATTGWVPKATPATVLLAGWVVTPSLLAAAKVIVKAGDVSVVVFDSDDWVNRRTLFVPARFIDRPE